MKFVNETTGHLSFSIEGWKSGVRTTGCGNIPAGGDPVEINTEGQTGINTWITFHPEEGEQIVYRDVPPNAVVTVVSRIDGGD